MWRKAITASTTFCQLRSSIFELHMLNHVLSITLPACCELRYPGSNFSVRVAGDQCFHDVGQSSESATVRVASMRAHARRQSGKTTWRQPVRSNFVQAPKAIG